MNKHILLLFLSQIFCFHYIFGQSYKEQFNDLISKNDDAKQRQLLEKWENENNKDPELYVAYFNYYVNKSRKEVITLGNNPKDKDGLKIMDQDTTIKEPVGFIYSDTHFDPNLLSQGFKWINKGINKYPNRLDMRFGKIYMYGLIEDYENFTKEIIRTIDYSITNNNQWTWADNKKKDNPKEFMLGALQDYQVQLYNTENDKLLENMKRIAEAVLKHYPDHIESLSNISIVYLLQKQYDKALEPLLKAEQLNQKDFIVLSNIAQAYKLKGDTKNAIKYYELTLRHGDERAKKYAKEQIEELKKQ